MLGISERTVEFHLKNIYARRQVSSRVKLILDLGKSTGENSAEHVESTVAADEENEHPHGRQPDALDHRAGSSEETFSPAHQEFAMSPEICTMLAAVVMLLGIALMIGGIITGKTGAVVIGIIVSGVAAKQLIASRKQTGQSI